MKKKCCLFGLLTGILVWLWDSAARVTDKVYQVEIAIPLKNIKFKSGKRVFIGAIFEHNGREFRVDSGYLRRNGINVASLIGSLYHYPDQKKIPWLKLISLDLSSSVTHDLNTHMDDLAGGVGMNFYFTKDASLTLLYSHHKENWKGTAFNMDRWKVSGQIRFFKWQKLVGYFQWRDEGLEYK